MEQPESTVGKHAASLVNGTGLEWRLDAINHHIVLGCGKLSWLWQDFESTVADCFERVLASTLLRISN